MWTRPLRELTPETSLGFEAVEFADWIHARVAQIAAERDEPELLELAPKLLEWQRWFLIHALELLPGAGLIFRFRIVLLLVARQNGKTTLLVYLILWRMFTDGCRLVIGTAQSLDIAEEAWANVVAIAEAIPELANEIQDVKRAKAGQTLVLDGRERYKIAAANRRGGRGLSGGEMVLLDELREHRTWDSWSAVSKTTMARERAQVYGISNAGDLTSIVLRHLFKAAVAAGGLLPGYEPDEDDDLDASRIAVFGWMALDENGRPRGIRDRDGWAEANPSMGYTGLSEDTIAAALSDPEHVFRIEVLCQFVDAAEGGPFESGTWEDTRVATVVRDRDQPGGYCIDMSHDRKMSHIAVGFFDEHGRVRGEIAASRPGSDWVIPWLKSKDRRIRPDLVTFQVRGAPVSSLAPAFEAADLDFIPWGGEDLVRGFGLAYDAVRDGTATHGDQPVLDIAAMTASTKPAADGWMVDRKHSIEDASPLVAWMGVVWLLTVHAEQARPSIYETRGLALI